MARHDHRHRNWFSRGPVCLYVVLILFLWCTPATGFAEDPGVPWSSLSSEERDVLRRYSDRWEQFSPRQQRRLQDGAREWTRKSPEERKRIRSQYDTYRHLPQDEQERLRRTHRWYENLPQDQKRDLRRQWKNRSRERPSRRRRR